MREQSFFFFFSSRRRHTRCGRDWSSDVCSSDLRRRFEFRGMGRGAEFYDDYAHHPTEVRATLAAVPSEYRRVLAVFQPHRYTRTEAMWEALGESLGQADVVVI